MDALALLCNLHGDGPVTLAALRDIGCEDLIGLEGLGGALLGDLLRRDERGVERFRREARLLRERLGGDAEVSVPAPPPARIESVEPSEPVRPPPQELAGTGPVVEAVLEMWRAFDGHIEQSGASNLLIEAPLSGLRAEEVAALARVGVLTLEELAEADILALSRKTELPYTHLAHMAFLARKHCTMSSTVVPVGRPLPRPEPELRPEPKRASEPETVEKQPEEGAAGPFA